MPSLWLQRYHRLFSMGALRPHAKVFLPFLARPGGAFVEIGARDGLAESLTPYLEKALGWRGLLVEPWPHLFRKCRKRRKGSVTVNVAAVDNWLADSYIEVVGLPPKTSIRKEIKRESRERITGKPPAPPPAKKSKPRKDIFYVATNSGRGIIERAGFDDPFDLLVVNAPGYENNALEGFDFSKRSPAFILARHLDDTRPIPNLPSAYEKIRRSLREPGYVLALYRHGGNRQKPAKFSHARSPAQRNHSRR